jgi:hypothetical protein
VHLQCTAGQRVERFNGRIEEVLQSHHFRSGEELETTLHRYVWLYNQQLPQSALGSKPPLQAMKDWHKLRPELFKKQPYYLPGCGRRNIPSYLRANSKANASPPLAATANCSSLVSIRITFVRRPSDVNPWFEQKFLDWDYALCLAVPVMRKHETAIGSEHNGSIAQTP